ncbi:MAG: Ig-like domain-containing protein, partial [Calditrichaeota bacterium]|nr:Ig-like domain-containing protein [Calditrichota bacterium]
PGNGDTLIRIDPPVTSGEVDTDLGDKFEVQILDNANNPVPGLLVSFAIVNKPAGASNESLTAYTELTDNNGIASTRLHLGTKVGDYTVRAFNISTVPVAV